jgi:hypothetical protein
LVFGFNKENVSEKNVFLCKVQIQSQKFMNESGRVYWVLSPDCPRYSAGINGKYSQ